VPADSTRECRNARLAEIIPDAAVQQFLTALASTNVQERQSMFSGLTKSQYEDKLAELQAGVGGPKAFVLQLLYRRAHARSAMEAMVPLSIVQQLGISETDQAAALIPYLETDNDTIHRRVRSWLSILDYRREEGTYDFSRYTGVIRETKSALPMGLVRYMYETSPKTALPIVADLYLDDDGCQVLLADLEHGETVDTLRRLAESDQWWIQLYVVETIRRTPEIRASSIVSQLEDAEHPLVQDAIRSFLEQ